MPEIDLTNLPDDEPKIDLTNLPEDTMEEEGIGGRIKKAYLQYPPSPVPLVQLGKLLESIGEEAFGKPAQKAVLDLMPEGKGPRAEASRQALGFIARLAANPVNWIPMGVGKVGKAGVKALERGAKVLEDIPIPKFTAASKTEDALELGLKLKGNKIGIEQLKKLESEAGKEFQVVRESGNMDEAMIVAHKKQMYREAREVATGEGGAAEYVAKEAKPLEHLVDLAKKEVDIGKVGQAKLDSYPEEARNIIKLARNLDEEGVGIARREVQSHAATEKLAEGLRPEVAKKLAEGLYTPGTAVNAEESVAMKYILADEIDKVFDGIIKNEPNKKVEQILGVIAEKGRALEAEKIKTPISPETLDKIRETIKNSPPEVREQLEKIAKFVGLNKNEIKPSLWAKFVEFATMVKLTGISTHVRALVGNGSELILRVPEKFISGAVDALVYGARSRNIFAQEALAESMGMVKAFKEASSNAWSMLVHPTKYMDEATKAGEVMMRYGAIGGKFGTVVRSPGRLIGSIDVLFKSLNKGAEVHALAMREALKSGERGTKLIKKVWDYETKNATPQMIKIAQESARSRVFQEELRGVTKSLNTFRKKHPFARLIVPFWNTPVNLLKRGIERTPLPTILPNYWKTLYKGKDKVLREELIGRMITGTALMTGVTLAAYSGNISGGGPKSRAKREIQRLTGWQPYSVLAGNQWVGYRGFEPLSSWLRAAADVAEGRTSEEGYADFAAKFSFSYLKQFAENPFFMGIHDLYEGVNDPEYSAPKFLSSLVIGSTIPVLLQQWGTRVWDPVVRQPKTFAEKIVSRLPFGASEQIKPMRTIYGDEVVRDNPIAQALGFTMSYKKGSKLDKELARLSKIDKGLSIGKPSRVINGYELTDDEYDRLLVLKGGMLKQTLGKAIENPGYDKLPDNFKIKYIRSTVSKINTMAKHQEFEKYYRANQ